ALGCHIAPLQGSIQGLIMKIMLASNRQFLVVTGFLSAALAALWLGTITLTGTPTAIAADPAPAAAPAPEQLPPGAKIVKLEALPTAIDLKNAFDYRQLVLTAHLESGDKIDVTRLAKAAANPANVVKISERGLVRPAADGNAMIDFTIADQSIQIPVKV